MTPVLLTIAGETRSITAWSKIPGAAKYHTIINRLRTGWPEEAAVFAEWGSKNPDRPTGAAACLPVHRAARRRRKAISFPIGELPAWGGCHSFNFPRIAA